MFIGIDGGQTKIVGILINENGEILAEKTVNGMPYMGELTEKCCSDILELVISLCDSVNVSLQDVLHICGGLCGIDTDDHARVGQYKLAQTFGVVSEKITLVNDAIIALWGGSENSQSILLQHGTAFTSAIRDGFGKSSVFDCTDIGRIFDIRQELLVAVARMIDGRRDGTPLLEAVLERFGIDCSADFGIAIDTEQVSQKEQMNTVSFLSEQWEQGEPTASELMECAMTEYVLMCEIMLKKLQNKNTSVVFGGGVLNRLPDSFLKLCEERLNRSGYSLSVVRPELSPVRGAALYATHLCGAGESALFKELKNGNN